MRQSLIVGFCLACCPTAWSSVSIWVSDPASAGGLGSVRVHDESTGVWSDPAGLQGIRLLAIAPAGRTAIGDFLPGRARLFADLPGATRVRLPEGRGSLYHYERPTAGGSSYGFFLVDPAGVAASIAEFPAAQGGGDPVLTSIGVAPDGASILAATVPEAGGNLLEIELGTGSVCDRTSDLDVQVFSENGLVVGAGFGLGMTPNGVLRFESQSECGAQYVAFEGPTPAWFGEPVASANASFVAFVAGDGPHAAFPFVVGASGAASQMCSVPAIVSGAGLLPAPNGPWLAVSDDGASCAWRTSEPGGYSRELFLARAPAGGSPAATHVTQDAIFEPYLDEVGVMVFTPAGDLLFASGDPGLPGVSLMRQADFFRAHLTDTGVLQVANLSGTSGQTLPPFLAYPQLEPVRIAWNPGAQEFLVYSRDAWDGRVLRVDADGGELDELEHEIDAVHLLEVVGGDVLISMVGQEEPEDSGLQHLAGDDEDELSMLFEYGATTTYSRGIAGPGGWYAFVVRQGNVEFLLQARPSTGEVRLLTSRPLVYGTSLGFDASGTLAVSVGAPGSPSIFLAWPVGAPAHRLSAQPISGFVLPGV